MADHVFIPIRGPRLARRIIQLVVGLFIFGVGIGLMVQSTLGLGPWDVLHEGLSIKFGLSIGTWVILLSGVVLLAWIPLKEPLGIGTVLNALIIGAVLDLTTVVVPIADQTIAKWGFTAIGMVLVGFGSGLYIGANLGPGPRDGLMTGIARRGPSIRLTRTAIEVTVLIIGILLGGTFGIGTILFAVLIGPLVQFFLPRWTVEADSGVRTSDPSVQ